MPELRPVPLAISVSILVTPLSQDAPPMDTSKLEQAVDRLTSASERLASKVEAQTTELAALRDKVNNPPAPADDTAGQAAIDGAVVRLSDAADTLDRANSTLDGASATSSTSSNAAPGSAAGSAAGSSPTSASPTSASPTSGAPADGGSGNPLLAPGATAGDVNAPGSGPFANLNPTA